MSEESIHVRRLPIQLVPDPRRTITRFFWPGEERAKKIIQRIKQLSPEKITGLLHGILEEFGPVNPGLEEILTDHYEMVLEETGLEYEKRRDIRLLIGAYFSKEYAFEAAALFNPSMVPADDQSNIPDGSLAFLMSLRAVGEGHISSITFRRGLISKDGDIKINPATLQVRAFKRERNRLFKKDVFKNGIEELTNKHPLAEAVLSKLPDTFTLVMLEQIIQSCSAKSMDAETFERICGLFMMIAESEYEMHSDQFLNLEDMVMFPISRTESQGMEDMRLVLFEDEDGTRSYYGTYTAYNGQEIMPQVLEVSLPGHARVHIMRGECAKNKGIAFFPKRIDGKYAVIGRVDSENIFLMKSDSINYWNNAVQIIEPKYDWEFVQMGNCGSPLRTEHGWLLLTHGVGPMRKYCIGAVLLDLDDPSKVIARLKVPLMSPTDEERSGYVPNVVYSCGALIHRDMLVIPYGISDMAAGFAIVSMQQLMNHLA